MSVRNKMSLLPDKYKVSKDDLDSILNDLGDREPTWYHLLMTDYVYHHRDYDYNNGLSFIDRLMKKLGPLHPEWNISDLYDGVLYSGNVMNAYVNTIEYMLSDHSDICYYGI